MRVICIGGGFDLKGEMIDHEDLDRSVAAAIEPRRIIVVRTIEEEAIQHERMIFDETRTMPTSLPFG